jgi:hypothetical protein
MRYDQSFYLTFSDMCLLLFKLPDMLEEVAIV